MTPIAPHRAMDILFKSQVGTQKFNDAIDTVFDIDDEQVYLGLLDYIITGILKQGGRAEKMQNHIERAAYIISRFPNLWMRIQTGRYGIQGRRQLYELIRELAQLNHGITRQLIFCITGREPDELQYPELYEILRVGNRGRMARL